MDGFDPAALIAGDKGAWDRFVARYAGVIRAAVARALGAARPAEIDDAAQDVFVKLLQRDHSVLRAYDPKRASAPTWLTVIARSVALDRLRRRRLDAIELDEAPEAALATPPVEPAERLAPPPGLLSARQELILAMLYDQEMEPAEVAAALGIEAQTVRSQHHKALTKLRAYFNPSDSEAGRG